MAKAIRPVFKPEYGEITSGALTSGTRTQVILANVDGDSSGGTVLRNMTLQASVGLIKGTPPAIASDYAYGIFGLVKWPIDAAAPTTTTMDYNNRAAVFCRTPFAVSGVNPYRVGLKCKTVTLRPGDELYLFCYCRTASSDISLWGLGLAQYWINEDNQ